MELQDAYVDFLSNEDDVFVVAPNIALNGSYPDEMSQIYEFITNNGLTYPFATIAQLGHCTTEFCGYEVVVIGEEYEIVALNDGNHFSSEAFACLYETGQMSETVNIIGSIGNLYIDNATQTFDLSSIFAPEPGTTFNYGGFSTNESVVTVSVDGSILSVNPGTDCGYFNVIASCEVPGEGTSYAVAVGYGNNSPEWSVYNSIATGFDFTEIWGFELDSNENAYFGLDDVGFVIYDGSTWNILTPQNSGLPSTVIRNLTIDPNDVVWVLTFGGLTVIENGIVIAVYNASNSPLNTGFMFDVTSLDNGDIYVLNPSPGYYGELFKFDGTDWYDLADPIGYFPGMTSDGETIWATSDDGLEEYDIVNDSWTVYNSTNTPFPVNSVGDIYRAENGDLWVCGGYTSNINYLWIAHKPIGGFEWEIIQNPDTSHLGGYAPDICDLKVHSTGDVWIATWAFDTFVYHPDIEEWEVIDMSNSPMETNYVMAFAEREDTSLWIAGWENNIAIYSGPGYNGINNPELPSPNYTLMNFPNPFNPETTISYSIPFDEKVKISIYNIKGQKVKTLVNEKQTTGEHQIIWDGRDSLGKPVSSGIYFYKMKTGDYREVRKMVLLK